jgi:hypothetical protein
VTEPGRSPEGMVAPHFEDARLELGGHLVRHMVRSM